MPIKCFGVFSGYIGYKTVQGDVMGDMERIRSVIIDSWNLIKRYLPSEPSDERRESLFRETCSLMSKYHAMRDSPAEQFSYTLLEGVHDLIVAEWERVTAQHTTNTEKVLNN